nr:Ty3/gypsy retrotransposon protein [Tanacetum cinerariifolium]
MSLMLCNEKIDVVQSWPIPSNVKEVRDFLGLTGYYRHFVQNYGLIARSLTALIKKNGFVLSNEAFSVFITLKQALLSTLVLWLPDFSKTFVVECDASSSEVGVILSQEEHPVAYFRKGFSPSSWFKPIYDQELLGLRITSTEKQQLLLKLMPYDETISHMTRKENRGADALSRKPHSGELLTLPVLYCVKITDIKMGLQPDSYTADILQ